MNLVTSRFGEIEVDVHKILTFAQGLPGFEDKKRFITLQPEEGVPFSYLQSVEDGDLAFILTEPFMFFPDYQFDLSEAVQEELNIREQSDVMVFAIVSVNGQTGDISLNLLAPVIVNLVDKLGKQVILHDTAYRTKHNIQPDAVQKQEQTESKEV